MAILIEVIVDRGVGGGEFLQGLYISELRHRYRLPDAAQNLPGFPRRRTLRVLRFFELRTAPTEGP